MREGLVQPAEHEPMSPEQLNLALKIHFKSPGMTEPKLALNGGGLVKTFSCLHHAYADCMAARDDSDT